MSISPTSPSNGKKPKLSSIVPHLVVGGAFLSNQLHPNPSSIPVLDTLHHALALGLRAFDTSPYYGSSEVLLGSAFRHPTIQSQYARSDYILMTKCGRIASDEFDYSREWVTKSVERSLERFGTEYMDVVFCHDVEFVTEEEVMEALTALYELQKEGKIKYVGISGFPPEVLANLAGKAKERFGRPLDAVQNYCHFTILNTTLYTKYVQSIRDAGVDCVFNASPLAMGLLRAGGVPIGELGDWHPAPAGLRTAAKKASDWCESKGENLASVALRFAIGEAAFLDGVNGGLTIMGGGSIAEMDANLKSARRVLKGDVEVYRDARDLKYLDKDTWEEDQPLFSEVRNTLQEYWDFSWDSPGSDWTRKTNKVPLTKATVDVTEVPHLTSEDKTKLVGPAPRLYTA